MWKNNLEREGTVGSEAGRIKSGNARLAKEEEPVETGVAERHGNNWSRSYVRHVMGTDETTGARILTLHNIACVFNFGERMGTSIKENELNN